MLPGDGRGPPPGRGAPGRACGRGIGRSAGCCVENGLLPTRGARGAGLGAGPGLGPGVAPGVGRGAGVGVAAGALAAGAGALGAAGGCGAAGLGADGFTGADGVGAAAAGAGLAGGPGRAAVDGVGPDGLGAAAAPLPAAGWLRGLSSAFLPAFESDFVPNVSRSRRATGASTVEDADLTNSPCSLSVAKSSLLVTPSSLANSCTRALPATTSPRLEATAVVGAAPRV